MRVNFTCIVNNYPSSIGVSIWTSKNVAGKKIIARKNNFSVILIPILNKRALEVIQAVHKFSKPFPEI